MLMARSFSYRSIVYIASFITPVALMLSACGASSDLSNNAGSPTGEQESISDDGSYLMGGQEDAPEMGGESQNIKTDITGRRAMQSALQALPNLAIYQSWLSDPQNVPTSTSNQDCVKGGSKSLTVSDTDNVFGTTGDRVTIDYKQCMEDGRAGTQRLNGKLTVQFNNGTTTVTTDNLLVQVSDDDSVLMKQVESSTSATGTRIEGKFDFPSLNILAVKATTPSLINGGDLLCPSSGKFMLTATDGASVTADFSPGGNMLISVSGGTAYTLACSELETGLSIQPPPNLDGDNSGGDNTDSGTSNPASGGGELGPPPAPG